ncbi:uncharacterized protein F4822DRAFT_357565 [Hypoxylon trugodes]|uniref:uncharacterized protein n=1 Tax=Hypoxylon trugodes TaxID=326681 RepID=UPI00219A3CEE|nr:uncharacterized protein F4822DRAFT_357565 [Hypoxylon trugodes]KAI1385913.1 hypothetical protein F4822DRAFT_357565 [Hypoxylon trugodes]
MKSKIWVMLTVVGLAAVSGAQTMPTCATNCLATQLKTSSCDPTDSECICADSTLMNGVADCVLASCTVIEGLAAQNATQTLCKQPVRDRRLVAPIATAVTAAIALAFVSIRSFNCHIQGEYQWADLCAVLAMVFSIPMDVFEFFMMGAGMGRDIWTLTPEQITNVVKYTWVTQVAYIPAIILTKIAIVLFFKRVFPNNTFQILCLGTIVHCFLFMISTTITEILSCIPVEYAWSSWSGTGEGVCYDNTAFWWAHSAINIATDLWILGLPIPLIFRLQLGLKKRIYLILMFSVGIIITVVSIVRFSGLVTYSTSTNPTYNNVMVATYSVIECNLSIVCCCMPATLAFLRRYFPRIFGGSSNRSSNHQSSDNIGCYTIGGSYNVGGNYHIGRATKGSFPPRGIQKTVTHKISYMPKAGDSDAVELIDIEEQKEREH